jgi:putative hemolysin
MFTVCYFALLVCLLLVALLAASEAVLVATNRLRLRHVLQSQVSEEHSAVQMLSSELSSDAQRFIATVTVAANMPLLAAAALTVWLAHQRYGVSWSAATASAIVAVGTIVLLQITPRLLVSQPGALNNLWWVRPARLMVALVRPPVALLMTLGVMLLRPLGLLPARLVSGLRSKNDATGLENAQKIRDLVESAQASGVLEESGKALIESIFTFSDTRVPEVMVPRPDILALPMDSAAGQVLDTLQESGFSRIPLHEGNIDRIAGILHAQDVLGALNRNEWNFTARDLLRPALYLPESQKLDEALAAMRTARTHLAIVIDEYGGTAGLLTVEDILEELVGEIADEHDRKAEDALQIVNEDTALADALLHTDDLEEQWDLPLPTGKFDTVGGFMIEQLGRALVVGDRVELPNALLVVQSVRGRRPKKILITRKTARERDE